MLPGYENITLATVGGGGLEELFQNALQEVLQNIHNVNTKADAKREINIKVIFKPDEERTAITAGVGVSVKLVGVKGFGTQLFTGDQKKDGKYQLVEHNPKQLRLSSMDTRLERKVEPPAVTPAPGPSASGQ
jgi:hypothetical protein